MASISALTGISSSLRRTGTENHPSRAETNPRADVNFEYSRSDALIRIARKHQPHSVIVADILNLPHPDGRFDFAIAIAVVHHLSTTARRVQAIASILRTLKPGGDGKALIYVWALEQKNSRRGWDKGDQQDVMVPWVMKAPAGAGQQQQQQQADKTFHRYYHLYEEGELERDIRAAGGTVVESGYEKDNWWAIATRES